MAYQIPDELLNNVLDVTRIKTIGYRIKEREKDYFIQ